MPEKGEEAPPIPEGGYTLKKLVTISKTAHSPIVYTATVLFSYDKDGKRVGEGQILEEDGVKPEGGGFRRVLDSPGELTPKQKEEREKKN